VSRVARCALFAVVSRPDRPVRIGIPQRCPSWDTVGRERDEHRVRARVHRGAEPNRERNALEALGVDPERIYVDHGLTGTNRERPGLREALAACRAGDTLVVTKLDRLARSLPDARDIADELTAREVKLNLGGSIHDPTDPVGRLLFNMLAMIAEFESDLIGMRTREGMAVARAAGKLRGRQPKLEPAQEAHLAALHAAGEKTPKRARQAAG
jgi:DNA invertase Pin-like site-specific DNA recombinase